MSPPLTQNARENYVASVVLVVLTSVCVFIRLALKIYRRQILQGPDWMCFVAAGIFITYASLILNCECIQILIVFLFEDSRREEKGMEISHFTVRLHETARPIYEILCGVNMLTCGTKSSSTYPNTAHSILIHDWDTTKVPILQR